MFKFQDWRPGRTSKIVIALGLIFILAGLILSMTGIYVSGTWRYRLTVEVETPEGIKTGSAVREVTDKDSNITLFDLPDVASGPDIKGEAVVVDLGDRGKLFVLISWDSYKELYSAFPYKNGGGQSTVPGIKFYNSLKTGMKGEVKGKAIPKMVTFEDINDPMSVKAVNPESLSNSFGEGVTLKSVTLEITKAPLRWGKVDQYLPEKFNEEVIERWKELPREERGRLVKLITFKRGE